MACLARQEGKCAAGVNLTSLHDTRPTVSNPLDPGDKLKLDPLSPGPLYRARGRPAHSTPRPHRGGAVNKPDAPRGIASPNPGVRKARAWSLLICALAAGLAFTVPGPAATAAVTRPASQQAYTTFPGRLYSVAAVSADDVWAAGLQPGRFADRALGRQRVVAVPDRPGVPRRRGGLVGPDAWAVGGTSWFSPNQTLAEHWNGKTWTQARTPSPPGGGAFNAVAATSPDNAWAVGQAGPGPGIPSATTPLIERWNGKTWTIQRYQAPATAAISPRWRRPRRTTHGRSARRAPPARAPVRRP